MTFSKYHLFAEIVTTRDHIILTAAAAVLAVFVILYYVHWLRPKWFRLAAWLLGVGGFYATLALWAVYIFGRAQGSY